MILVKHFFRKWLIFHFLKIHNFSLENRQYLLWKLGISHLQRCWACQHLAKGKPCLHDSNHFTYVQREWCWMRKDKILLLLSSIKEGGLQTNSILEWFNRTGNSLVGTSSIVWAVQHDAEDRRIFLNNAMDWTYIIILEGDRKVLTTIKESCLLLKHFIQCKTWLHKDHDLQRYDK